MVRCGKITSINYKVLNGFATNWYLKFNGKFSFKGLIGQLTFLNILTHETRERHHEQTPNVAN